MKWPFALGGAGDLAVRPLDTGGARAASDIHARTFARPWTDGEIATLVEQTSVVGFAAHEPAERGGAMIGFVLARRAADEAEILTIAVRPDWQGHGVGRRLMDTVLADAHRERVRSVFLEVDESNAAACALYRRLGFSVVADRPDYYRDPAANAGRALIMRRNAPANRPRR